MYAYTVHMAQLKPIDPVARLLALQAKIGTRKDLAQKMGVTPSYMSDVINRRRDLSPRLLKALGLRRVIIEGGETTNVE